MTGSLFYLCDCQVRGDLHVHAAVDLNDLTCDIR